VTAIIRALGLSLVRFFYPSIELSGREKLPDTPTIVVANHPNGLLDPVVLRLALARPMAFLAKSTFFTSGFGRLVMRAFGALPAYRPRDGADTSKNRETFARCYSLLAAGGHLALFPEGTTHSDPMMRQLKTGAARIALGAKEAQAKGLSIVPAGLLFEDKQTFRSRVAVALGSPISLAPFIAQAETDERGAVEALTAAIDAALSEVVLEADSGELWRGLLAVAAWTRPECASDLSAREARARLLARAYGRMHADDPERAGAIVESLQRFARVLRALDIDDPFALGTPQRLRPIRLLAPLTLLAPIALLGTVLGWPAYRLTRTVSTRLAHGEIEVVGTYKALAGALFFTLSTALEVALAAHFAGARGALGMLLLAPLSEYTALRYFERLELRAAALRTRWVQIGHARIAQAIESRRRELADQVDGALASSM